MSRVGPNPLGAQVVPTVRESHRIAVFVNNAAYLFVAVKVDGILPIFS